MDIIKEKRAVKAILGQPEPQKLDEMYGQEGSGDEYLDGIMNRGAAPGPLPGPPEPNVGEDDIEDVIYKLVGSDPNLEDLILHLDPVYDSYAAFFSDNPGAVGAVVSWIAEYALKNPNWESSLRSAEPED